MKYYKDINNKPFVFESNVTAEIIAKVEDTHKTTLTEITLADYEALIAPTAEELLQQAKDNQLQTINTAFDDTFSNGYITSILDANSVAITMDARYDSITRFKAGYDLSVLIGVTDMIVRDFNNTNHTVTLTDASTMITELGINFQLELNKLWGYKDSINSATTITEVESVLWV